MDAASRFRLSPPAQMEGDRLTRLDALASHLVNVTISGCGTTPKFVAALRFAAPVTQPSYLRPSSEDLECFWQTKRIRIQDPRVFRTRAGTPPRIDLSGYLPATTTAPAAIMHPSPSSTPSKMVTLAPIQQSEPIRIP